MRGQSSPSLVPNVIKTNIPLDGDPAQAVYLLQSFRERIEKLSQQDRLSKFCACEGFLTAVEVGQYFMTKDTGERFYAKACRPRNDGSSQPKGWIQRKHENWTRTGSYDQLLVW